MAKNNGMQIPMWLIWTLVIGFAAFVYFYTKPTNSIGKIDQYISEYIDNSVEIELNNINKIEDIEFDDIYVGFSLNKLHRSKLSSVPNNRFSFFATNHGKYFKVVLVSSTESMKIHRTYAKNTLVKARVCQWQLDDPGYGTKENPIPILYLEIPKYKQSQNYWMIEKMQKRYEESVYYYLAYIMPKDEFKERFTPL